MHFRESLLRKGVKADISLEGEKLDSPLGVDYFLWLPVKNMTSPNQKQFLIGAKVIKECVDNKLKVYVHCQRGHGRGPSLVIAYFILEGLSFNQAFKKVKDKREVVHLRDGQIAGLKKFESWVGKKKVR